MFNLAIFGLLFGALPIVTAWLFVETTRRGPESQKVFLATTVEAEKIRTAWRARHQMPSREL